MQKRAIAIFLILLMLVGAFACKGEQTPAQTAAPTQEAAAAPTQEPAQSGTTPLPVLDGEYFLPKEDGTKQLTIYWKAPSINFDTSDMWIWYPDKDGRGYQMYPCAYGAKVMINVPNDVDEVGFIVRVNCSDPCGTSWGEATKDYESDRFVKMEGGDTQVYLVSGEGNIYFSNDGGATLWEKKTMNYVGIVSKNEIKYGLNPATKIESLDQVAVYEGDRRLEIESLSSLNNSVSMGTIKLKEDLDITKLYDVEIQGYERMTAIPTGIFDSEDFIQNYTYDGNDLGAIVKGDQTTFKLWAPTASRVVLNLFEEGNGGKAFLSVDMDRADKGVWTSTQAVGSGTYYTYTVTTAVGTQEAVDPYAKALGVNGDRGMVIDLDLTDPNGFAQDAYFDGIETYRDAIIWEVHVRDFSNTIAASKYPGKYLAFTEEGLKNASGESVGLDYLVKLGITHVHLQPVYDYATVDETKCNTFNWGYDPKNYNAPEGSYSTDPYHGEVRIGEFKQMVQSLHAHGIGVIMDVVYNHTYDGNANLNRIVPYYYYRYTASGENSNGSGCGNETASERVMFRKFMVDSVTYWASEYHIDGFRFDLMALHDLDTMQAIEQAVHAINPKAILYGEGWTGGTTTLRANRQASQANIAQITASEGAAGGIAVFNDAIRDGLKGSVFNATDKGYISGDPSKARATNVAFGIEGGGTNKASWRVDDGMVINYMSSHDNRTLWDKLTLSNPDAPKAQLVQMNRFGASIVAISKGTVFWLAGEEMMRSKGGNGNSYNASDEVNNLDWDELRQGTDPWLMQDFYRRLVLMRRSNAFLRNADVSCEVAADGSIVVRYTENEELVGLAVINPTGVDASYTLPDGEWSVLMSGTDVTAEPAQTVSGEIIVPQMSVYLVKR